MPGGVISTTGFRVRKSRIEMSGDHIPIKLKIQFVAVPIAAPLVLMLSELISVGYNHYNLLALKARFGINLSILELPAIRCQRRHSKGKRKRWRRRQFLFAFRLDNSEFRRGGSGR